MKNVQVKYEQIPQGSLFRVGPVSNYAVIVAEDLTLVDVVANEVIVPMSAAINQFQVYRLEALGPEVIFVGSNGTQMGAVAVF
jgi:hypothetical protein